DNQFSFCNFSNAVKSPINLQSSSATIEDCYFHDNTVSTSAAAINLLSAENVSIKRNLISNNISTNSAGAISVELCNPSIKNNVIVNNQGGIAGAINLRNITSVTIENNTIANNMATSAVSGLFFVYNSYPILQNNILIDDELLFYNLNSVITASYSCLSEEIDGNNNFVANPLFVDASAGSGAEFCGYSADWTLQEASPCIDAGSPNSMFNDIEDPENPGNPLWPAMGTLTNDIGAFGGSDCAVWVDNEEDSVIPDKRQISIFPNPFNPSTTISYNLDVDNTNNTKINIYNVIGQLVKHISVNKLSAGQHSVIWNGKDNSGNSVASGVYYFQVETDNIVDTTKGILLK
ncbi:MAG: FlgD immunoglobulin-like domain containing protein, partial [Candidatus Cloacimonadota bacterium]|nr:FlgD immunoglobulin-like domain containing protein [Candidatus Cloacimonadota bacterium]